MTPTVTAEARADGSGTVRLDGAEHTIQTACLADARAELIRIVAAAAQQKNTVIELLAREPDGEWPLTITPDGQVHAHTDTHSESLADADIGEHRELPTATRHPSTASPAAPGGVSNSRWLPTDPGLSRLVDPFEASFLAGAARPVRASRGWRGALTRMGMPMAPGPDEQRYLDDVAAVSQHWPGPRTIVVANGKGGSAKTPTTIGLAAAFARYGGGGVCAWSNHQMRGTLGWHTVQAPHAATTQDLLTAAPQLLTVAGQSSALARYVHHQPDDRYDVLQADPTKPSDKHRTDHAAIDTLHALLSRFYRVIVADSDNDESTPHWLRMIDHADLLVVATTTDAVRAEAGRLMLETLRTRGPHARELAERAVVVISQAHIDEPPAEQVADQFRRRIGLAAATIPYDRGMKQLKITYEALQPPTQRAYLAAAAMTARAV